MMLYRKEKRTRLRTILAAAACKLVRRLLHLAGQGGTTLPGRIALWIDRDILSTASQSMHIMMVTGTNGKTTTSRMMEKAVLLSGRTCLLNRSGANLLPGIAAEFVCNTDWKGRPRAEYAVIECDEGALKQAAARLQPEIIVVTNLFRDQLDRYGEIMHTREEILEGILCSPDSIVCLNADCVLTASMAGSFPNRTVYYGVNVPAGDQGRRENADAKYCLNCGEELTYHYYTYAHLGGYECRKCGYRRPEPETAVNEILEAGVSDSRVLLTIGGKTDSVRIGLPAIYNIYNALAAACALSRTDLDRQSVFAGLETARAPFGRMEAFQTEHCAVRVILVKNPAGCNQAMDYILEQTEEYGLVFCLNDRTADGHDISWIWDADMEKLIGDSRRRSIWVSGTRAEDMRLRLKYAGLREEEIRMEKDYSRLITDMTEREKRIFVLPNYTAMLDFRREFLRKNGGTEFWKG